MYFFWIMLVFLSLYIMKVVRGPNIWDRFLGMSLISTKIVIIIIIFASFYETSYILDLAIASILLGFICIIFTAHFLMDRERRGEKT